MFEQHFYACCQLIIDFYSLYYLVLFANLMIELSALRPITSNAFLSFIGNSHFSNGGLEREYNNAYHRQTVAVRIFYSMTPFFGLQI